MDLSFHSQQFGNSAPAMSPRALPRLSYARLMAMINGQTGMSMLRHWRTSWLVDQARPDSMAARRRFFAQPATPDVREYVEGGFCPPLARASQDARSAWPNDRNGKFPVYQGSSVLGKMRPVEAFIEDGGGDGQLC